MFIFKNTEILGNWWGGSGTKLLMNYVYLLQMSSYIIPQYFVYNFSCRHVLTQPSSDLHMGRWQSFNESTREII